MNSLKSVSPEFAERIAVALIERGHADLVAQLASARIQRWMYNDSLSSGYVCLGRPHPAPSVIKPADPISKTIFLLSERGFNIDIGRNGRILGIEFVANPGLAQRLKDEDSLTRQ